MDIKEKVDEALRRHLDAAFVRLVEDGGISGFVVSDRFQGVSALDRQRLIDAALRRSPPKLTKAELRKILAIAALTSMEYEAVGSPD